MVIIVMFIALLLFHWFTHTGKAPHDLVLPQEKLYHCGIIFSHIWIMNLILLKGDLKMSYDEVVRRHKVLRSSSIHSKLFLDVK